MFDDVYRGKNVWVSGGTGFKGAWLITWLQEMGANVSGLALAPQRKTDLYNCLDLDSESVQEMIDIRDSQAVEDSLLKAAPDFVFHLAAQPLVIESYKYPADTYSVNVNGTIHVLEALRKLQKKCAAVFVTTDKCYENQEWEYGYREVDRLGGKDPYSSSKACVELVVASWRKSFFGESEVRIATARAGNVIGGGDWAEHRIVPDCIRNLMEDREIEVRNPAAVRPWQHVLEPLCGYLLLGVLMHRAETGRACRPFPGDAYNFGPGQDGNRNVGELVKEVLLTWPGSWTGPKSAGEYFEAHLLQLVIDKARADLNWAPVWTFEKTVSETVQWYKAAMDCRSPSDFRALTVGQLSAYCKSATEKGIGLRGKID